MRAIRTAVLVLVAMSVLVAAREVRAQNIARVYVMTPAPGQQQAFEKALTAHAQWRKQAGDPWNWSVYEVVDGENVGTFVVRSGGHTWADLDAYDAGFEQQGTPRFNSDVGPLLAHMTSSTTQEDTALARLPKDEARYGLIHLTHYHVKPEHGQAFHALLAKIHKAIVDSDWPAYYAFASAVSGPDGQDVIMAGFHGSWADFAEPDPAFDKMLADKYGEEEAGKMMETFGESVWGWDSVTLRLRPDMSVMHESM